MKLYSSVSCIHVCIKKVGNNNVGFLCIANCGPLSLSELNQFRIRYSESRLIWRGALDSPVSSASLAVILLISGFLQSGCGSQAPGHQSIILLCSDQWSPVSMKPFNLWLRVRSLQSVIHTARTVVGPSDFLHYMREKDFIRAFISQFPIVWLLRFLIRRMNCVWWVQVMSFVVLAVGRVIHLISHVSFRRHCMCRRESGLAFFRQGRHDFKRTERLMEARLNRARNNTHYSHTCICSPSHMWLLLGRVFSFMDFESTKWQLKCIYNLFLIQNKSFHKWYGLCSQHVVFICKYLSVLAWTLSVSWNVVSTMEHV